jgi:hypothetical protein
MGKLSAWNRFDDGLWNIVFYETLLGRVNEKTGRIAGVERRR